MNLVQQIFKRSRLFQNPLSKKDSIVHNKADKAKGKKKKGSAMTLHVTFDLETRFKVIGYILSTSTSTNT